MPEISVLLPYYNDKAFLSKSIESVLNQTFKDFELILINHATTDNCREIARSYNDPRIRHVDLERNNGAGGGMIFEEFIKNARGRFIKTFCADDEMEQDCLEKLYNHLSTNPECDVVFGDANYINSASQTLGKKWSDEYHPNFNFNDGNKEILKKYFNHMSFLPYPAAMFRQSAIENMLIDKSFIIQFDQSLWIQMLINNCNFNFLKDCVIRYRIHENQESSGSKVKFIRRYDFYESIFRARFFFNIKDFSVLKFLLDDFYMLENLTEGDEEYFPFVISCYYIAKHQNKSCRVAGYEYVHDYLQDPLKRKKIRDKFDFGIAEFRSLYQNQTDEEQGAESLGIKGLFILLMSKIWSKLFS